jgi:hypothetical protein
MVGVGCWGSRVMCPYVIAKLGSIGFDKALKAPQQVAFGLTSVG